MLKMNLSRRDEHAKKANVCQHQSDVNVQSYMIKEGQLHSTVPTEATCR